MNKKQYQFKLREDMPPGFIENKRHPIYPAMTNFLKKFEGEYFSTLKSFVNKLKDFHSYLDKIGYEKGKLTERSAEEGLFLSDKIEGVGHAIFCKNDGVSEFCQFGFLDL